ncbi:hypothetical protein R2F25_03455 [Streptomyces sp. UP1A-1]|nr:hypothetical protein [Streptomyces sp. UP1A-1]
MARQDDRSPAAQAASAAARAADAASAGASSASSDAASSRDWWASPTGPSRSSARPRTRSARPRTTAGAAQSRAAASSGRARSGRPASSACSAAAVYRSARTGASAVSSAARAYAVPRSPWEAGCRAVGGDRRQPVREPGHGRRAGQRPGTVEQRWQRLSVGLQHVGQRAVGGPAPVGRGGGVDRPAQQRAVEAEPVPGPREDVGEQVRGGGGRGVQVPQGVEDQAGVDVRSVRRAYRRRHRQQQVAGVSGEAGQRGA